MAIFKLNAKAGSHAETDANGQIRIYNPGDIIETESDLVTMFPGKFEKVLVMKEGEKPSVGTALPVPKTVTKQTPTEKPAKSTETGVGATETPAPVSEVKSLGRDVTKRFPLALDEDFQVFADGGAFFVTESDAPQTPLHPKPLHKKDVEPFIKKYLKT